jgi:hypothetical protein
MAMDCSFLRAIGAYQWLLLVIIVIVIGGYFINGH